MRGSAENHGDTLLTKKSRKAEPVSKLWFQIQNRLGFTENRKTSESPNPVDVDRLKFRQKTAHPMPRPGPFRVAGRFVHCGTSPDGRLHFAAA
jgi:hypothetical protein